MNRWALFLLLALSAIGADRPKRRDLPPANEAVVRFCEEHVGKQVGDGQCGTLATEALRAARAEPSRNQDREKGDPAWGTPVERFDDALPGDIIQYRDVQVLVVSGNGAKWLRSYPHHTAVIARNRGSGRFDVYEQNVITAGATSERRLKMRRRDADLRNVLKGTIRIYRPDPAEPPSGESDAAAKDGSRP